MARAITPRPGYAVVQAPVAHVADEIDADCEAAEQLLTGETSKRSEHSEPRPGALFRLSSLGFLAVLLLGMIVLGTGTVCLTDLRRSLLSAGTGAAQGLAATERYESNLYLDVDDAAAFAKDPKAVLGVEEGLAKAAGVKPADVTAELSEEDEQVKVDFAVEVPATAYDAVDKKFDKATAAELEDDLATGLKSAMGHDPEVTVAQAVYGSFTVETPDAEALAGDEKAMQDVADVLAKDLGVEADAVELSHSVEDKDLSVEYLVSVEDEAAAATEAKLKKLTEKELTSIVAKGLHEALESPPSASVVEVGEVSIGPYYDSSDDEDDDAEGAGGEGGKEEAAEK